MIPKMTKSDHLEVAEFCFTQMQNAKTQFGKRVWEATMYDSLFAWAGWKE